MIIDDMEIRVSNMGVEIKQRGESVYFHYENIQIIIDILIDEKRKAKINRHKNRQMGIANVQLEKLKKDQV